MLVLDETWRGRSRARLMGHAVGLLSYEVLALAGAAGELAWFLGLQLLPALIAMELIFGAVNAPGRRLKRLALEVYSGTDVLARQAQALTAAVNGLPLRSALRSVLVWLGAGAGLMVFFGLTWRGFLLLLAFGAIPAAMAQAGLCDALVRAALAERADGGLWPPVHGALSRWPSLRTRFWVALAAPLTAVLVPLAALQFLGVGLSGPILTALSLPAVLSALAWGEALVRHETKVLRALEQGLQRLAGGDFDLGLVVSGPDALGRAALALNLAVPALERRERSLRVYGPGVDPRLGGIWLESLESPAETRFVAVLLASWLEADASLSVLEPGAQIDSFGKFYETVQGAVLRGGGTVMELGAGQVLAVWGAPGPQADSVQDNFEHLKGALEAAWILRSSLPVAASQHRLRHAGNLTWSVAVASGAAGAGVWGPKKARHWALVGAPMADARRLSLRPGGPWVADSSVSVLRAPYAVQRQTDRFELSAGP